MFRRQNVIRMCMRTDEQVRQELVDGFPGEVHRAEALPEEREVRPCGIFDPTAVFQEDEVESGWRECDVKAGL